MVAEWDGGRGQDGVEGRHLFANEMVFRFGVQRSLVCPEVVVPPSLALDVEWRLYDGAVCWCMNDGGHDGSGEWITRCGWVEV